MLVKPAIGDEGGLNGSHRALHTLSVKSPPGSFLWRDMKGYDPVRAVRQKRIEWDCMRPGPAMRSP